MGMYEDKAFVIKKVERDWNGKIVLTQNNYHWTITEIYMRTDVYIWERIKGFGLVYKGKDYGDNEFGVWLYQMTCCAADAQIIWMKYMTAWVVPHIGQWVEVTWIVEKDDAWELIISSDNIVPIPPMDDPYTYY